MPTPKAPRAVTAALRNSWPLPPASLLGFAAAAAAILLIAVLFYRSLALGSESAQRVTHTLDVIDQLQQVLSSTKDAETGQRGYLLTGTETYLGPFNAASAALPAQLDSLKRLTTDSPLTLRRLDTLDGLVADKLVELRETIELRRDGNADAALALVRTDRGRLGMDRIRASIAEMVRDERALLAERQSSFATTATQSAALVFGGCALLLILLSVSAYIAARDHRNRELQAWLRSGQMGLAERVQGEQRLETLGNGVLEHLAGFLGAQVGSVYVPQAGGSLRRVAGYALTEAAAREDVRPGTGLLGQAAKERRALRVSAVPAGYLTVASTLGQADVREVLIAPAVVDDTLQAVTELGFFRALTAADEEFVSRISETFGIAMRTSADRTRLEALLEETQRQAEELQTQQEELRVSNEELEEHAQSLKESTARLEEQRSELEQTNAQLEEQAELLESQKDELNQAQTGLKARAQDLERANQYKSEFLANMSHELRTPLNSTLILSKLLADNKSGNLVGEQVRFAETIHSAGNDLLALINDILDLSKIEARKVELDVADVRIAATVESLARTLEPLAQAKQVQFTATIEPSAPLAVRTDEQRLAQIVRNLVSNAIKFTERGGVKLRVYADSEATVSFAVTDTGIGIPPEQQQVIFEAFRQADGSTHRKYGGTGLGLSISRDLARMLGGDIAVRSVAGEGSTFTLTLPVRGVQASLAATRPTTAMAPVRETAAVAQGVAPPSRPPAVDDDRDELQAGARCILVIEDDVRFAAILRDLAHELGFQCVVTTTANDGLAAAARYRPSAILLDINLPDKSGLVVLDQLKRDPDLRSIPVHISSVADYTREALQRGAVSYLMKPVQREQLVAAITQLEAKFSQQLRRVLVVEDDERQRDSIRHLLAMGDVQIIDVKTAADALAQLQATSFDCMVMDLNLPDLSGYQLLEQMATHEGVAFPPVIVYTGRSLTGDEETALRRFASSIIIKGARSPERLLDEVTLFLHQVEAKLPPERQRMLKLARDRDATLEGRRILVVEDDVRNIFALTSLLEPQGATVQVARNGREALEALERASGDRHAAIDLVLMDIMMPEMDGITAMREIRKRPQWRRVPIIALTAKAMPDDQANCLAAGANDYIAKPLDAEKLISLVRVWMPKFQV